MVQDAQQFSATKGKPQMALAPLGNVDGLRCGGYRIF